MPADDSGLSGAERAAELVPGGAGRAVAGEGGACEFAWRAAAYRAVGCTWLQAAAIRRGMAAVLTQDVFSRLSARAAQREPSESFISSAPAPAEPVAIACA